MTADGYTLDSRQLGALPVINAFFERLGLARSLATYVAHDDARVKLAPAVAVAVVVANLLVAHRPVYALRAWAAGFEPALLGLSPGDAELLNDDRVGRMLTRLFDADRASLLTRLVLDAVAGFGIDVDQLHNDSTSLSFAGDHAAADGRARDGKPTAAITHGHSKARRPDLKQLLWILTVTADGAVPISYRTADGNTNDDVTHIATWDSLVALTGRVDFLYVADSKLSTRANMTHIHDRHGRFVAVLPASRKEDRAFRDWIVAHHPVWTPARRQRARRHGDPDDIWETTDAPASSSEGHRIIWVRSSTKIAQDAHGRQRRIDRAVTALEDLNRRLTSPQRRLRTLPDVQRAATAAVRKARATRWLHVTVTEHRDERFRAERRGRDKTRTSRRKIVRLHHHATWTINDTQIAADAASDGCYPLISNDTRMTNTELFTAYKWQPNLEKRHAQLKGTQLVAPTFLRDPARIEGLLCCHFIAMLIHALIERTIRTAMTDRGVPELELYPEDRACAAPTAARVLDTFADLTRRHLLDRDGHVMHTFEPDLTALQRQLLDLLDIPTSVYTQPTV